MTMEDIYSIIDNTTDNDLIKACLLYHLDKMQSGFPEYDIRWFPLKRKNLFGFNITYFTLFKRVYRERIYSSEYDSVYREILTNHRISNREYFSKLAGKLFNYLPNDSQVERWYKTYC